jgi:hypothetical protein
LVFGPTAAITTHLKPKGKLDVWRFTASVQQQQQYLPSQKRARNKLVVVCAQSLIKQWMMRAIMFANNCVLLSIAL